MKLRVTFALALLTVAGCSPMRSNGAVAIAAGDQTVYFVREVRGMNYDSLALSPSPDPCQDTDGAGNYVFVALGPLNPYYRWDGSALHVFNTSRVEAPATFPVPVIVHELHPLEWQTLETTAAQQGLQRVDVPVSDSACRRWF